MKKLLLLLVAFAFVVSCTSSDSASESTNSKLYTIKNTYVVSPSVTSTSLETFLTITDTKVSSIESYTGSKDLYKDIILSGNKILSYIKYYDANSFEDKITFTYENDRIVKYIDNESTHYYTYIDIR